LKLVAQEQSEFQLISFYDSYDYGRLMMLDDHFHTSEKDHFFYQEPLAHVPLLLHPKPESVLIIGGGDGGVAEEVLKHPSVSYVYLVEHDDKVIDMSKLHINSVHQDVWNDERLNISITDGELFLKETDLLFDVIIIDLPRTDKHYSISNTKQFMQFAREKLSVDGVICMHLGSPFYQPMRIKIVHQLLKEQFSDIYPFGTSVPLWGGYWMMACATSNSELNPISMSFPEIKKRLQDRMVRKLYYINPQSYKGLFTLPNYAQWCFNGRLKI
jgi:spermidine synthase